MLWLILQSWPHSTENRAQSAPAPIRVGTDLTFLYQYTSLPVMEHFAALQPRLPLYLALSDELVRKKAL
jgi:hypothetical protein